MVSLQGAAGRKATMEWKREPGGDRTNALEEFGGERASSL
jgi:hypothetical protein